MISYSVDRTTDSIVIDTENWIQNSPNALRVYKMSGRPVVTYITEIVDKNISDKFKEANSILEKGEIVLVSKVASEISMDRKYRVDERSIYHIPVMQVMGLFKDKSISMDSFTPLYDKILIEKIEVPSFLYIQGEDKTMIGRVLKVGTNRFDKDWNKVQLKVKVGDLILVKDNATTSVNFEDKKYYVIEENSVVGIFSSDELTLDNLTLMNESVLLRSYISPKLLGSDMLLTPNLNYEDLDFSDVYNRNMFQVVHADKSLAIKEGEIIYLDRSVTTYVYFKREKFYLINGMSYVDAKIE